MIEQALLTTYNTIRNGDHMANFKIVAENENFYTIKNVPIFEMHNDRGFPCDQNWMTEAINNHLKYKSQGHRPPIIIGHNTPGNEKEAIGFLDNLVLRGKQLYADLVRIPKQWKEKIVTNAYPSRSVEVLPTSKRILALALLGGTTPYFPLPQMVYQDSQDEHAETKLWFQSPIIRRTDMDAELKNEINATVAEALKNTLTTYGLVPQAPVDETVELIDPTTGLEYANPIVAKAVAAAKKTGQVVKKHPVAAAGAAGVAAGRMSKSNSYAINDQNLEVYQNGRPFGVIVTYEDMAEAGMQVPTAVKDPSALPDVTAETPDFTISEEDVGPESDFETELLNDPGAIAGTEVQPLNREDSDQFSLQTLKQQNYDLQRRLDTLENANKLINVGRRAEQYQKWLESQKQVGVPVGDIEATVKFMLSLTPEQAENHKQLLSSLPKIALSTTPIETVKKFDLSADALKTDYAANKPTYAALGVTDKDLQYANFTMQAQ